MGVMVLKLSGGRRKDGRKAIEKKNGGIRTVNKKDILEKPQGGCVTPLCRRGNRYWGVYLHSRYLLTQSEEIGTSYHTM